MRNSREIRRKWSWSVSEAPRLDLVPERSIIGTNSGVRPARKTNEKPYFSAISGLFPGES